MGAESAASGQAVHFQLTRAPARGHCTRAREVSVTIQEKHDAVKVKAQRCHISGGKLERGYWYGDNPYTDMLIENALFCDMFPEEVPDKRNFYGFCRYDYELSHAE